MKTTKETAIRIAHDFLARLGRQHGPMQSAKFKSAKDATELAQKLGIVNAKYRDEWCVSFETVSACPSPDDVIVLIDDGTGEPLPRYIHPNPKSLDPNSTYVVALCQIQTGYPTGLRFVLYRELGHDCDPRTVFETTPIIAAKLIEWGYYDHSKHLGLTNGGHYGFDAHGIWLTQEEMDWFHDVDNEAPWVNGLPPLLPPK